MPDQRSRNRREYITSRMRLREYDYATPGYYFVTACCQNRSDMFGHVSEGRMILNTAGVMVDETWLAHPPEFSGISIDSVVTMPNHFHAIVGIGVKMNDPETLTSLIDVMQWFKSVTTTRFNQGIRQNGWPRYDGRLWQRGFHDHIVRSERELDILRNYIAQNPERWEEDVFHDG